MSDRYSKVSSKHLVQLLHEQEGKSHPDAASIAMEVRGELNRRCRGGISSIAALLDYYTENCDIEESKKLWI